MSAYAAIQQRWEDFLSKIETRFHEVLSQTEALLPNILALQDFDTTPFCVVWMGIDSQMKDLISKIDDTWSDKVGPAFDAVKEQEEEIIIGAGKNPDDYYKEYYELYYREFEKGHTLMHKLEKEKKRYEVRTFCEAARKLQKEAARVLSRNFMCTQCSASLPVRDNFFRSYYQTCEYCRTVNTFEPGTIARNIEHFALHPLAEEKAMEEYFGYWDIEQQFRSQREDRPKKVTGDMVLEAQRKYAEKYLKARIEIIPEYEKQYEKDLAAKIEHVRKYVLGEHEWKNVFQAKTNDDDGNDENGQD